MARWPEATGALVLKKKVKSEAVVKKGGGVANLRDPVKRSAFGR